MIIQKVIIDAKSFVKYVLLNLNVLNYFYFIKWPCRLYRLFLCIQGADLIQTMNRRWFIDALGASVNTQTTWTSSQVYMDQFSSLHGSVIHEYTSLQGSGLHKYTYLHGSDLHTQSSEEIRINE